MIHIAELFPSIQGESTFAGKATTFVRCAGCNLDCSYCDTRFAQSDGNPMDVSSIITTVDSVGLPAVCITGGEPLLQDEIPGLARELIDHGYQVSVETNGSLPVHALPIPAAAVIDVKCPGSGAYGSFATENITDRRPNDQFKFVLTDRVDFDFARAFIEEHHLADQHEVLFSPTTPTLEPSLLAEWILQDCPSARLNLQLHRIIWPGESRGR